MRATAILLALPPLAILSCEAGPSGAPADRASINPTIFDTTGLPTAYANQSSIDSAPVIVLDGAGVPETPESLGFDGSSVINVIVFADGRAGIVVLDDNTIIRICRCSESGEWEVGNAVSWSGGPVPAGDISPVVAKDTIVLMGHVEDSRENGLWVLTNDKAGYAGRVPRSWGRVAGAFDDGSLVAIAARGEKAHDMAGNSLMLHDVLRVSRTQWPQDRRIAQPLEVLMTLGTLWDDGTNQEFLFAHYPSHTVAVAGDMAWVAPTYGPELIAIDERGNPIRRAIWQADRLTVTEADADRWYREYASSLQSLRQDMREASLARASQRRHVAERPAVLRTLATRAGHVLASTGLSADGETQQWLVFSREGRLLNRLHVPERVRVLYAGENQIFGATAEGAQLLIYNVTYAPENEH